MEAELIHELSAAYALNALDEQEERFYERHLAHCQQCQADVALFSGTAAALAYAVPATNAPPSLRPQILAAIRAESVRVRARRRWAVPVAVLAAAAVGGLIIWTAALHSQAHSTNAQRTLPLRGANGSVVRTGTGEATMIISGLQAAPTGKTYEAWIIENGRAIAAGLFSSSGSTTAVHLTKRVPKGAQVGVTIEAGAGATQLTHRPLFTSAQA